MGQARIIVYDGYRVKEQRGGQLPQTTESAHLTWLYRTVAVQKAFQSETV